MTFAADAALTITLASLASSATAGRESTFVENTTNRYLDALVVAKFALTTGTPANDKAIYLFAYGSIDDGTTYPDTVTGTDAAITMVDPTNLRLIGVINAVAQSTTYTGGPFSVATAFGGVLPERWGIVVRNFTGIALTATEANHAVRYQGIELDIA